MALTHGVTRHYAMQTSTTNSPAAFLTPTELCQRWHLSTMTLWRMRRDQKLRSYRVGHRGVRFAVEDILKLESQSVS